ncbi:MAG: hypothetical protein ABI700_04495 [Chloroflexota bacterium]
MNINRQAAVIQESNMKITASKLIRWAGLSALLAGLCYVLVGVFHPANVPASVTTTSWAIVHVLACAMSFFGLLGLAGLYARQAEKSGWLGLVGFVMLSLWLVIIMGFSFVEAFILPSLATAVPTFMTSWMGMLNSSASPMNLGVLPTLWTLSGPLYMFGGLLFGIAIFRARILPRWAGVLLALGCFLAPVAVALPLEAQPKMAIPVGLALAWLGYALWSERREQASKAVAGSGSLQPLQTGAD